MSRTGLVALTLLAASVVVAIGALIGHQATATGPGSPAVSVAPSLANLWLCNVNCTKQVEGVEEVNLLVNLDSAVTSLDPKCVGTATASTPNPEAPTATPCPTQGVAAFQFDVLYNQNIALLSAQGSGIFGSAGCGSTPGQGVLHVRCPATGKLASPASGPGAMANVRVQPQADDYSLLHAHQENGLVAELILQSCQLLDARNNAIKMSECGNAAVTIRYLEGDVQPNCLVDVFDQQQVAFRWGIGIGSLLYSERFDLEPSALPDGDIDTLDLQVVAGRHGSTCNDPHPPQPPVDPQIGPTPTP
jgi:hypothetical protein